jgi:GDP-mannose 4,6-dehydratase
LRVLITGITGFVGSHLAEYLLNEHPGHEVYGINISNIENKVTLFDGDLNDLSSLITIFDQVKPEIVFHLAAQSFVSSSYTAPADTINTNVVGTSNLLEAIRFTKIDPVIHVCSSSEVYGQVDKSQLPINESTHLNPVSPYAVSKVGEDMLAYMYHQAYELKTIRSRMFTHSGPRRGEVFVDSFFALQLARIEQGIQKPVLKTGNLDSVRTFCDVRDTVKAYWMLVDKCDPGEVYNIGGNRTMTIKDMLDLLLNMSSVKNDVKVEQDPKLIRPADVTLQIPDCSKFVRATGWEPSISYEQTLQDMLDYWRSEVKYGRI